VFFDLGRHIEPFRVPQLGSLFPCGPPASKGNDPSQGGLAGAVIPVPPGAARRRITTRSPATRSQSASFPRTRAADLPAFDSRRAKWALRTAGIQTYEVAIPAGFELQPTE
jgi:hypothetical protein